MNAPLCLYYSGTESLSKVPPTVNPPVIISRPLLLMVGFCTKSYLCTHLSLYHSSCDDIFSQSSSSAYQLLQELTKALKVTIVVWLAIRKLVSSSLICHWKYKVEKSCSDYWTIMLRLGDSIYRVQGGCTPLCRCSLSGVGKRRTFHGII